MKRRFAAAMLGLFVAYGAPAQPVQGPRALRIVTWNVSWLGHAEYPPVDDVLQIERVAEVVRETGADILALQEIGTTQAFERLIEALGGSYSGMLPARTTAQRMGLLYGQETVRLLNATDAPLADAPYVFADRPPLFARFALRGAAPGHDLLVVVVHLKAFADQASYERRFTGLELLKSRLDREAGRVHVILAGDFNDQVFSSITPGRDSPLRAFRRDSLRYRIATAGLEATSTHTFCATSTCEHGAAFDHFIVSASLSAWAPLAHRLDEAMRARPDYVVTISDHLPVALELQIPSEPRGHPAQHLAITAVFPNPFSQRLEVELTSGRVPIEAELIDVLGRVRAREAVWSRQASVRFDATHLQAGTYFVRIRTTDAWAVRAVVRLP